MKVDWKSTNGTIVAILVIVGVAIAFWMFAISPKREEAAKLDEQVSQLEAALALHEDDVARGEEAKRDFPVDYQKLVVLGKAVPGDDETASLLVQISRIAKRTKIGFQDIELTSNGGGEESESEAVVGAPPTEASAALLPLGATVGPAGLAAMPYTLTFKGDFFRVADFIDDVDALVKTRNEEVRADGRLITLDGFSLVPDQEKGFPWLEAQFTVTTFVTPPDQKIPVPGSLTTPETVEATPAAATIGAAP